MSSDTTPASEQKQAEADYRTSLLRLCYSRIPESARSTSISVFQSLLSEPSQPVQPTESEATLAMFVSKLRPLLTKLNVFDIHRRLAASQRTLLSSSVSSVTSEHKTNSLRGASDVHYASSLRFDLSAQDIKSLSSEIETETLKVMDSIAALKHNTLTTNNVLVPLIQLDQRLSGLENSVCLMQNVSPDKAIRDASNEAEVQLRKFGVEISMRKDVYQVIKAYSIQTDVTNALPGEWKRYLEFCLRDYRRAGLDLDDANYDKIKTIKKRMSTISSEFSKNLNEENTRFVLEAADLKGMPQDWTKARLISADDSKQNKDTLENVGKYDVSLKYPDLFPVLRQCSVGATREKLLRAHNSRCIKENTEIMEELVRLRYQQARLLGKANHSEHVLEIRMAKQAKTAWDFLWDLNAQMDGIAAKDMDAILALKKAEMEANGEPFDGVIHEHDFRYYCRMREEKEFAIDKESLREYFPLQVVIDGALEIYQSLLGLKFVLVGEERSQFKLWHEEVQLYQVVDAKSDQMMGYFFLDLHPREGKYGHACKITLQTGCRIYDDDGKESGMQFPVNVMLCNFPKPTSDKPSLLGHDDVVTFFHEFGHVMHQICGQPMLSRFAGTAVERDFVEAPSQMLENWCWKSKSLNLMSGHYLDPKNKKIPQDLLDKLSKSKNANCGLLTKRQLFFGILDQTMHRVSDDKGVDTQKLCQELQPKVLGIEAQKDTNFVASFGHLAGGYDAQYYGYMWSEVYSADMFHTVFCAKGDESLLDAQNGMRYRQKILEVGGSRDAMDSLTDFLGRAPNNQAFLKEKGLDS